VWNRVRRGWSRRSMPPVLLIPGSANSSGPRKGSGWLGSKLRTVQNVMMRHFPYSLASLHPRRQHIPSATEDQARLSTVGDNPTRNGLANWR